MGTISLRRQISFPGAIKCWNSLLFSNCVFTSSFPHPRSPGQPFCCSFLQAIAVLTSTLTQPCALAWSPSLNRALHPSSLLPRAVLLCLIQPKLDMRQGEEWQRKELQETISLCEGSSNHRSILRCAIQLCSTNPMAAAPPVTCAEPAVMHSRTSCPVPITGDDYQQSIYQNPRSWPTARASTTQP